MADRTTLVDNNTWNNTHIATVGKAMSSNEKVAYEILSQNDVDYVLVVFGGLIGYSGDDINKVGESVFGGDSCIALVLIRPPSPQVSLDDPDCAGRLPEGCTRERLL